MNNFKIAIDCVLIGYNTVQSDFNVLLSQRTNEPMKNEWALPGGFVKKTEEFEETAKSILHKETGIKDIYLDQLKAYSLTDIDDDNRIISIAYFAIVNLETLNIEEGLQLSKWFTLDSFPKLPFDHGKKLTDTMEHIRTNANTKPFLYKLLPEKFTLNQLQRIYESLFSIEIDNRNFRKRVKKMIYLEKLEEMETKVSRRPGYFYRFDDSKYDNSFNIF